MPVRVARSGRTACGRATGGEMRVAEPAGWRDIAAAWLIVAACLVCLWLA